MERIRFIFIIILFLLLSGCTHVNLNTPISVPIQVLDTPTMIPTSTASPAIPVGISTQVPDNPTLAPTSPILPMSTQLNTPIPGCEKAITPVLMLDDLDLPGSILYEDGTKGGLWMLGGSSSQSYLVDSLDDMVIFPFGYSPDGKWFAYAISPAGEDHANNMLILRSATGEVITKTMDLRDSYSILRNVKDLHLGEGNWVNENLIETNLYYKYSSAEMSSYRKSAVFDPFQGTWQNSILEQLPNLPDEYSKNITGISPDETRIMYDADIKSGYSSAMTLWDTTNEKQLFEDLELGTVWDAEIEWSPDSSQVVYYPVGESDKQGVLLLSSDGGTRVDIISTNGNQPTGSILSQAIWSSDGHYIAILHVDEKWRGKVRTISVYELASKKYIYSCSFEAPPPDGSVRIMWSPDNWYLLSYSYDPQSSIYLLDLTKGTVMELPIRGSVDGWSSLPWHLQP